MKYKLSLLVLTIIVLTQSACVVKASIKTNDPKTQYNKYVLALKQMPVEKYFSEYWSQSAVAQGMPIIMDISEENEFQRKAILFSINFPAEMQNIFSIKQSVKNNLACLLVIGETDESNKITFNIPYVFENNSWLIKEVFIQYMEEGQETPIEPNCRPAYS